MNGKYNLIKIIDLTQLKEHTRKVFEINNLKGLINSKLMKAANELDDNTSVHINTNIYTVEDIQSVVLELQIKGYKVNYNTEESVLKIKWQLTDEDLIKNLK